MTRMTWRFLRSSGSAEKAERRQGVGRSRRAPTQTSLDGRPGLPSTVAPRLASKKTDANLGHQAPGSFSENHVFSSEGQNICSWTFPLIEPDFAPGNCLWSHKVWPRITYIAFKVVEVVVYASFACAEIHALAACSEVIHTVVKPVVAVVTLAASA